MRPDVESRVESLLLTSGRMPETLAKIDVDSPTTGFVIVPVLLESGLTGGMYSLIINNGILNIRPHRLGIEETVEYTQSQQVLIRFKNQGFEYEFTSSNGAADFVLTPLLEFVSIAKQE